MLHAGAGVQGIGRLVMRIDESSRAAVGRAGKTAGIAGMDAGSGRRIHGLKRGHPAVLRQIVVEEAEAGANHGVAGLSGSIGDAQARARTPCGNRGARR